MELLFEEGAAEGLFDFALALGGALPPAEPDLLHDGIDVEAEFTNGLHVALKAFSNSDAAAIMSSKEGVSPKNIGPSISW